jgi:hypothetical protein
MRERRINRLPRVHSPSRRSDECMPSEGKTNSHAKSNFAHYRRSIISKKATQRSCRAMNTRVSTAHDALIFPYINRARAAVQAKKVSPDPG